MKVAIQGIDGSFHADAAKKLFDTRCTELVYCENFQDVFRKVSDGIADKGIVAIENSLHGSINAIYRLLKRYDLWVSGEITLEINQYLIASKPLKLDSLKKANLHVLSQTPALSQAEQWLDEHLPNAKRQETHDTAESVKYIMKKDSSNYLAIAGKNAADLFGASIIAGPINDDPHNYTRFVVLQKEHNIPKDANRTLIILKTDHKPGALLTALQAFNDNNINLSKLDSHPIAGDNRHYAFYIDYDVGLESAASTQTLKSLENNGFTIKILGSYRV